ncbi:hypothetical protein Tco_0983978 [Tanacetum coccineum]
MPKKNKELEISELSELFKRVRFLRSTRHSAEEFRKGLFVENGLYNLHLNKGENGDFDTLDPQLLLGSGWLVHARLYITGAIVSVDHAGKNSHSSRAVD